MSRAPRRASGHVQQLVDREQGLGPTAFGRLGFFCHGWDSCTCMLNCLRQIHHITTDLSANRSWQARSMTGAQVEWHPAPAPPGFISPKSALSKPIVKFPKTHPTTPPTFRSETNKPRNPKHPLLLSPKTLLRSKVKKRRSRSLTLRSKRHRLNLLPLSPNSNPCLA